jgi:hypothetical protein
MINDYLPNIQYTNFKHDELNPYYIRESEDNFIVASKSNDHYVWIHCPDKRSALIKIAELKTNSMRNIRSFRDYTNEYNKLKNKLTKTFA